MRILVTGASGFIGSHIVAELLAAGHEVIACVRDTAYMQCLFPQVKVLSVDFLKDTSVIPWIPRLRSIDAVINAVGILDHPRKQVVWTIHRDTPCALFDACVQAGVKQVIQISALGIEHPNNSTPYAKSKLAAENHLLSLPLACDILRPSLVYGKGSYGGTSLFRGLAALPWIIPMPGSGKQFFQPIHIGDLSKAIASCLKPEHNSSSHQKIWHAVGPEKVSLSQLLQQLRSWMGFSPARMLSIPMSLIKIGAKIGNFIPGSVLNTAAYTMMNLDNIAEPHEAQSFFKYIGFTPRSFTEGLRSQPSTVQDRWHAKLYTLKPLLQGSIALTWLLSGLISLFFYDQASSYQLLTEVGLPSFLQPLTLFGSAILDCLLGLALLYPAWLKRAAFAQIGLILFYTAIITWQLPYLWLEPWAILKNIPLLTATITLIAMESDR